MGAETSSLWWISALVAGSVGAGMLLYGVRQKAPLPLVFGLLLSALPMTSDSGGVVAALALGAGALYLVFRKRW